jgi:acyl carrier protein
VAYVITTDNSRAAIPELRNSLKTKLPFYMLPAAFEVVESFPLTSSGKINRRALPEPQFDRPAAEGTVDLPTSPLEEMLLTAWREVLKVDLIGIHDNFFDLGGHSLLAARLVSNVRSALDVDLNMVEIFEAPTISSLAEMLYPRIAERESDDELSKMIEELSGLTDEEAQLRLAHAVGTHPAIA